MTSFLGVIGLARLDDSIANARNLIYDLCEPLTLEIVVVEGSRTHEKLEPPLYSIEPRLPRWRFRSRAA